MGEHLSMETFAKEAWFPVGIAQSVEPAASQVPEGFEAWRLHTSFDSHLLFWPIGNLDSIEWWQRVISIGGGGIRWGEPPNFDGGKIERIKSANLPTFLLTENSRRKITILLLPLDEKGNGRTLAELETSHLNSAFGGLQVGNKDLLLFFRQADGESAEKLLEESIDDGNFDSAREICFRVGTVLGKFHSIALAKKAMPNDERKWNNRLKKLEERVQSNTLWRAPHTHGTVATITHRNFSIKSVIIEQDDELIDNCHDIPLNSILPPSRDYPAVRDLASAYRSLASISEVKKISQDNEISLRKSLFEGWKFSAPKSITSPTTLDSYRGGVPIWEYEQFLEEAAMAQAMNQQIPERTKWWLNHVNRIQAEMYRSRSFAAISLICGIAALFAPFTEQWIQSLSDRIYLTGALLLSSLASRWFYRIRAPPQY